MGTMLFRYEGKIGSLRKAYLEPPDAQKRAWRIVLEHNGDFPTGRTIVMIPYWPAIEKDARLEQPMAVQSVLGGYPLAGIERPIQQCLNSHGSPAKVRKLCEYVTNVTGCKLRPKQRQDLEKMFSANLIATVRWHVVPHGELAGWINTLAKMADADTVKLVFATMQDTLGKEIVSAWTERICKTENINQKEAETALVENVNFVAIVQGEPEPHLYPVQEYFVIRPTAEDRRNTPIQGMLAGVKFSPSGFKVTVSGVKARLTERQFKLLMFIAKEIESVLPFKEEESSQSSCDKKRVVKIEPAADAYTITIDLAYACLRVPSCHIFVNKINFKLNPHFQLSTIFKDAEGPKVLNVIFETIGDRNHAHWVPRP